MPDTHQQTVRRKRRSTSYGPHYNDDQLAFFKKLVVDERITEPMVNDLIGIPFGTIPDLCRRLDILFCAPARFRSGGYKRIWVARRISELRLKYARELAKLFPRTA